MANESEIVVWKPVAVVFPESVWSDAPAWAVSDTGPSEGLLYAARQYVYGTNPTVPFEEWDEAVIRCRALRARLGELRKWGLNLSDEEVKSIDHWTDVLFEAIRLTMEEARLGEDVYWPLALQRSDIETVFTYRCALGQGGDLVKRIHDLDLELLEIMVDKPPCPDSIKARMEADQLDPDAWWAA